MSNVNVVGKAGRHMTNRVSVLYSILLIVLVRTLPENMAFGEEACS